MSPLQVAGALGLSNRRLPSGKFDSGNREYLLETGEFLRTSEDVRNVVVGVAGDKPVFVRNVAEVTDGGAEPTEYVRMVNAASKESLPAVTISIAKRKGTNAVEVAGNVLRRIEPLKGVVIPSDVKLDITRQYGETAAEKSNELLLHMLIAVISVSLLIAITLGLRESLIVFLAIPVTLALTLAVFYLYGYTLNRITLFALIFSIGILVDDAIVIVENIVRHWRMPANRARPPFEVADRGRRRGGQSHHPGDPHGGRRDPADGVCRRVDGAVHAADPDRRQRRHGLLAAGGADCDAVGRGAHSEAFGRRLRTGSRKISSPESTGG